jgi:selenocysteine lyase/cysteine desulfurase
MLSRNDFIKKTTLALGAISFFSKNNAMSITKIKDEIETIKNISAEKLAENDAFWSGLRRHFSISHELINLNHGGVSPQPKVVQRAHIKKYKYSNLGPTHYMWEILDKQREPLREKLAEMLGCSAEEVSINRNTTEGLNSIIFGLPLQKGDEVVLNKYDYPNMMNAWQQRQERDGIKLNWVEIYLPSENDDDIVNIYEKAITPNTKIVHLAHIINWNGQVMPVRKIADMAHKKGCEVIVDGAHSFAQIDFKISDLDCDYFATSLHKWLCAPFGTGAMYIKKQHIAKIWPLLSAYPSQKEDIRKFEMTGTRSFGAEMAVLEAINFHESIGIERKEARMHFLKNYLIEKLKKIDKVVLYTSQQNKYSVGQIGFGLKNIDGNELSQLLIEKHKINTTPIVHHQLNGIRVAPHFFTSTKELDFLVEALKSI